MTFSPTYNERFAKDDDMLDGMLEINIVNKNPDRMNTPWGVVRGVLWNKTKEGTVETYVKEQALRSLRKLRSLRLILHIARFLTELFFDRIVQSCIMSGGGAL